MRRFLVTRSLAGARVPGVCESGGSRGQGRSWACWVPSFYQAREHLRLPFRLVLTTALQRVGRMITTLTEENTEVQRGEGTWPRAHTGPQPSPVWKMPDCSSHTEPEDRKPCCVPSRAWGFVGADGKRAVTLSSWPSHKRNDTFTSRSKRRKGL